MRARPASPSEDTQWDPLVESCGGPHILQSRGWAAVKEQGGWRARRFVLEENGEISGVAQALLRDLPLGQRYAYAPRGPLLRDVARLPEAARAVAAALRDSGAFLLLFDPEVPDGAAANALERAGLVRASSRVQPARTLVVDISREPDSLLGEMRRKTRQYIRKAERDGVATEEGDDIAEFYRIERVVAERNRFGLHERGYFEAIWRVFQPQGRAHLFFARLGEERIATLLVLRWADRAWEMFGGWTGEHPEARPFYLLKWRAMLRLRQLGVRSYDMWGLAETARSDDPMAGVENFKLGFGGEQRAYVGAWEVPVKPLLYPMWRVVSRLRPATAS
jgi:lipid II:glycine glycyltransferase (peptidoglycan interpeptide bridge formation enzyme)